MVPVLDAARKYCVDILVSHCEKFLASNLSLDNVCILLEQAHGFVLDSLKSECLRLITEKPNAVLQSEAFTDLCVSCVTSITESDDLRASENNVYEAIIRWAEAECIRQNLETTAKNRREVLGETLYNVRYHHVDEEFLLGKLCADKILKSDDLVDIINHKRNKIPLISAFMDCHKKIRYERIQEKCYRNGRVASNVWLRTPGDDGISFKSSADVYLHGFGSFHTVGEPSSVDLKVFEGNVCLVQSTKTLATPLPDAPHMGDILLDQPIKIHAGKTYSITERSNKAKYYYFEDGKPNVKHQHFTIKFMDSERSRCTNTDRGQIPYLILSL